MTAVAGDLYDFIELEAGGTGVLVADVSGHGVPAALIASMVKVAMSSLAGVASDPATVLSGKNRVFHGRLDGQFITANYVLLEPQRRVMISASAGHPPTLLWRRSSGQVTAISEHGLILGMLADPPYENTTAQLEAGDRVIMYTDGIVEATNRAGEPFGEERLRNLLESGDSPNADALADRIIRELDEWCGRRAGRPQEDDLTLVVVELKG